MANARRRINAHGLRLLTDWEKGPNDGSVPLSANGAALSPYVCPGGELTLGYGCTRWFDGGDVEIHHRLANEDEAIKLLIFNLEPFEDGVARILTRPANDNQFSGFVALGFNIGLANLETTSALKEFNAGRVEDAAANFRLWNGATCERPFKKQRNDARYASRIAEDHKGGARWVGPDGQYCRYMLRYVGLLNRHDSEALLVMGRDWERTIRQGGIESHLESLDPSHAKWNAKKNRWEDQVNWDKTTPFKDVLAAAYYDRLPALEPVAQTIQAPSAVNLDSPLGREATLDGIPGVELPGPFEEDELLLNQAAASETIPDTKGSPPVSPQPIPAAVPSVSKPEPKPSNSEAQVSARPVEVGAAAPKPPPVVAPLPPVVAKPPPMPPPPMPPSPQVSNQNDYGPGVSNMFRSKRFWGGVLIIGGRLIIVADVGGNFAPFVRSFIGDGVLMDWSTGVIVNILGEALMNRGEKRAEGPIDTPKRVALATPVQ